MALGTQFMPLDESIRIRQNVSVNKTSIKGMKQMRQKEKFERNQYGRNARVKNNKTSLYTGHHDYNESKDNIVI